MDINEKRKIIKDTIDLSGGRFKDNEIDFLFDFVKGKLGNLIIKNNESHSGYDHDGKYIMTTKTVLSFLKNGIKKVVNVSFDDNKLRDPKNYILNNGRDIINEVKENIHNKGFDKVREIVDKLK